jgi:hypothetical protein
MTAGHSGGDQQARPLPGEAISALAPRGENVASAGRALAPARSQEYSGLSISGLSRMLVRNPEAHHRVGSKLFPRRLAHQRSAGEGSVLPPGFGSWTADEREQGTASFAWPVGIRLHSRYTWR